MTNFFGTDGIRNKVGIFPFDEQNLCNLGKSISTWSVSKINSPKILIANDTRISSSWIKSCLKSGLLQYDVHIYDAEILPTPAVYQLVTKQKLFDFGIMITASHNLYPDNGIKIISQENEKLKLEDEIFISELLRTKNFKTIDYENLGQSCFYPKAKENYIELIKNFFPENFLNNTKIIIDCANGATSEIAPIIFNYFGAKLIVINNKPNGKNINYDCGSTKPSNLQNEVLANKADIGFAFDGDGDRIIVVNNKGEIKDGDDILALLSQSPKYQNENVVGTIVSNFGLENFIKHKNKNFIRTQVGDKYVAQKLKDENLMLGGEPSGHIIMRDYLNSSDGIFTALIILQEIIRTQNWKLETFDKFPQITKNLKIKEKKDLNKEPFVNVINNFEKQIQPGRLIVRYSGTEPILRIVIESEKIETSNKLIENFTKEIEKLL